MIYSFGTAAAGFQMEGDPLGLGKNLFSSEPALGKILDFDVLNAEIGRYSAYYVKQFA